MGRPHQVTDRPHKIMGRPHQVTDRPHKLTDRPHKVLTDLIKIVYERSNFDTENTPYEIACFIPHFGSLPLETEGMLQLLMLDL